MILRVTEHRDERRRDLEAARDLAEVEGDVGADEMGAVGGLEAGLEGLDPA